MSDWVFPEIFLVTCLGLIFGSFATALIHRAGTEQSWFSTKADRRSSCPHCNAKLEALDLIPVFSWLFLRGKCRHCGAEVSPIYPLTEFVVMALCLILYLAQPSQFLTILILQLFTVPFLWALVIIDFREKLLPNSLMVSIAILGGVHLLARAFYSQDWTLIASDFLLGALLYGAIAFLLGKIMKRVLKKEALGMGDVKFFAVAGLWLGVGPFANFLILSGVLGVILGVVWIKVTAQHTFPFGPALIATFYILLLFQGL